MDGVEKKLEKLRKLIAEKDGLLVGLSGGVDSTLIAKVGFDVMGEKCVGAVAKTDTGRTGEFEHAVATGKEIGLKVLTFPFENLELNDVRHNSVHRCAQCKEAIGRKLLDVAKEQGLSTVAFGVTSSDLDQYRPGIKVADDLGIWHPLIDAGLTKTEVRILAKELGLKVWDRPSESCLATRLPYNTHLDDKLLHRIDQAEVFLHDLGIKICRVRLHEDVARIEAGPEDMERLFTDRERIVTQLIALGFKHVTLDLSGYTSGSMDAGLK